MSANLLRRLTTQPASRYLGDRREELTRLLEEENYLQRFAGLVDGERLVCADALELAEPQLAALSPRPEEGWMAFSYDFARDLMFPGTASAPGRSAMGPGPVFFLALLQVLLDTEAALLPADPLAADGAAGGGGAGGEPVPGQLSDFP